MMKQQNLLVSLCSVLTLLACTAQDPIQSSMDEKVESIERPNVIFVFSDDQRYNSLGMTGDPITQTPNLDQLANEGVFFNQTFITSPICGPSRANIFTSQWERKNEIGFHFLSQNSLSEQSFNNSWLMQLKDAGYSTAFIGKHHINVVDNQDLPLREQVDFAFFRKGHIGFHLDRQENSVFRNLKNKTQIEGFFEATKAYLSQNEEFGYFYDTVDESFKGRLSRRDPTKPFAAWINFNLPHAASIGGMGSRPSDPEHYRSLYQDKFEQIPLPKGYPLDVKLPPSVFATSDLMSYYEVSDENKLRNKKLRMNRAVYAIDKFIGDLRDYLEHIGEADNTIIVFASDNGLLLGEHGLGGKTILYDENVHVPLIIYSPHFEESTRGTAREQLVVGQDIPASILDMLGVEVPKTYQGKSVKPLIELTQTSWRKDVFLENLFTDQGYPRQEAVRTSEYKYIRSYSKESDRKLYLPHRSQEVNEPPIYEELYHLTSDPAESINLASQAEYAEKLVYFRNRTTELRESVRD